MGFQTAIVSARGGRSVNEDSVRTSERGDAFVLAVADGLGGHGGGDIASEAVTKSLCALFIEHPDLTERVIGGLFSAANQEVLSLQAENKRMKSTGVALFAVGNRAMWAHVGDSRLYYFLDGRMVAHTADHSVSYMAYRAGDIGFAQIRFHEDRSRVLRAFGAAESIRAEISAPVSLVSGSSAFLLCTDGFWENVAEDEMEIELSKSETPEQWLALLLSRMGGRLKPDSDNYTAAAAFYLRDDID